MEIDLLNHFQVEKSADQNQSQLINMYLEEEQTTRLSQYPYSAFPDSPKGEYKYIAYPTWGLDVFCDTLQSNVRALYEQNDVLYAVAGNQFYSINSNGVKTALGTLNTSSGFAKIVAITGGIDTNNQLVIIDGTNGYYYNINTAASQFPIASVNFNQTAVDITSQDDYVIAEKNGSMSFYISAVSDATTWNSIDFGSKFRQPDKLSGTLSYKGQLWLFGTKTIEVWQDTGNVNFPFERREDIFIEEGLAAPRAYCIAANSLFYLAKSRTGGYALVSIDTNSYQPQNVTTKAVSYQINKMSTVSDCVMYAFAKDGHEFVSLSFPTANQTFLFDASNLTWVERSSLVSSTYGRFLGNCHAFCYGQSLVGDYNSGKIYKQSSTTYTENGTAIKRTLVTPHIPNVTYKEAKGKRIYVNRLQIECQSNVGTGTFLLEMSKDHGNTWETIGTYTVPTDGSTPIHTTSLGSSYFFTFRITTTDNFNFTLLGFLADVEIGNY